MDRLERLIRLADKCMERYHKTKSVKYNKRGHSLFDEAERIIRKREKCSLSEGFRILMDYKYD